MGEGLEKLLAKTVVAAGRTARRHAHAGQVGAGAVEAEIVTSEATTTAVGAQRAVCRVVANKVAILVALLALDWLPLSSAAIQRVACRSTIGQRARF